MPNSIEELIREYKDHIRETHLDDEIYKWKLLHDFGGRPDLSAADFNQEIYGINYGNLMYPIALAVVRHIARDRPEDYRKALSGLFDETVALQERIDRFRAEIETIYRGMGETLSTHHDERTISILLTFKFPEKYTFYKSTFYKRFCGLLGIKPEPARKKYVHYLDLMGRFIDENIIRDTKLLELVDGYLGPDCFPDPGRKILAQDILFQMLDKANNADAETVVDTEDEDDSENAGAVADPNSSLRRSLNIILYGPPGTGKTYTSIEKAVEIAEGGRYANHKERKDAFDRLRSEGQIEFVTFHQNYSYEDFMVGIKPEVESDDLLFGTHHGIFYEIAARARKNYEASKNPGTGLHKNFEEVFQDIVEPLSRGLEVPVQMVSGINFHITDVNDRSISFRKASGGTAHTLSISTLKEVVNGTRIPGPGLGVYYLPLADLIKRKSTSNLPAAPLKRFVLIIDEINRANISRVFGELITLLEDDKRLGAENELRVTLPNGEKDFGVPPNLYIVGTMNTADKSIALIDIALRRRFEFQAYYPDYSKIEDPDAKELLRHVNNGIFQIKKSADFLIGHAYFMKDEPIERVLRNKVIPLLMEYLAGNTEMVCKIFADSEWDVQCDMYTWTIKRKDQDVITV